MTDPNAQLAAYNELLDPNTSQTRLAQIATSYPEYASAIAAHPNVYPELEQWAWQRIVATQTPAPAPGMTPPAQAAWQPQPLPVDPYAADVASAQANSSHSNAYTYPAYVAPQYATAAPTNTMAILSLVMAFVFAPLGIVLGHLAKKQIRATGEQGNMLATIGLAISYVVVGFWALLFLPVLILGFSAF